MVEFGLTKEELLFMYGHLLKNLRKLESIRNTPNFPVDAENLDADIRLYASITNKIKTAYPGLETLDSFNL